MLHADKANLESDFRVRMLNIREKELMFFVRNCQNLANLAALIACMAQSGLIFTKYIDFNLCGQGLVNYRSKELLCAEFTYPIAVFITMGLCLLCMWVSMLVSLLAPGLALRGPDGSMHECVRMIGEEYEYALAILACALLMFFVSAILWSWASQHLPVAIMLTIILVASVRIIWSMTRYTVLSFSIDKDDLVTGQMTSARSAVGRMRAHGYARLHEEMEEPNARSNAHPDATRGSAAHPPPPPPPKPARVWWGLRLVEQVRASPPPLHTPTHTHTHTHAHAHAHTRTRTRTRTHTHTHARGARARFSAGVISSLVFFFSFLLLLPHALSSAAACRAEPSRVSRVRRRQRRVQEVSVCVSALPQEACTTRRHRQRLPRGRASPRTCAAAAALRSTASAPEAAEASAFVLSLAPFSQTLSLRSCFLPCAAVSFSRCAAFDCSLLSSLPMSCGGGARGCRRASTSPVCARRAACSGGITFQWRTSGCFQMFRRSLHLFVTRTHA